MNILPQNTSIQKILILAMSAAIFVAGCDSNPFDNNRFNQKIWLANPVNGAPKNSIRLEMSDDLIKNHLKIGMKRQQTRKLLGETESSTSYCTGKNGCDLYPFGEYVLVLVFDSKDKLIKREVISI